MIDEIFSGVYWIGKIFFSFYWLIYLLSLYYEADGNTMFHITGILSLLYFISNVRWWHGTGGHGSSDTRGM